MSIDIAHMAPFIWVAAGVLVLVIVIGVVRFFWHHVLRFVFHAGLAILLIVILLAVLRYFKVF